MNIGFSPFIANTSTQLETSRTGAERSSAQNGESSSALATVKTDNNKNANLANAAEPSNKTQKAAPNETSAEAHRKALSDPNSALFKELQSFKNRDREVRSHEQTHLAAAGSYALGGPTYQFQRGPDGQRYAVGGHVNIDTSEVAGNPEATLRKAETVRRAALAPVEPSSQDRRVAAQASNLVTGAQQELAQLRQQETDPARIESQDDSGEPSESQIAPTEEAREKLEGNIRNTGALGNPKPNLDLII